MNRMGFILIPVLLAGCLGSRVKGDPDRIGARHPLVLGSNRFAFGLFQKLLREEQGNVFISPMSIYLALGMTRTGAAGKSAVEISRALGIQGQRDAWIAPAYGDLIRYLQRSAGDATFLLANALWAQCGYRFLEPFLKRSRTYFGAPVQRVVFGSGEGQRLVNGWIRKKTRGKIRRMLAGPLSRSTRLLLVNSIYFKGKWKKTFPKKDTRPDDFYLSGGNSTRVPMMRVRAKFPYVENERLQAVILPYKKSGLAMGVVLPRRGRTNVITGFDERAFFRVMGRMVHRPGRVLLPRFRMEYGVKKMNPVLQALGVREAFDIKDANFSGMNGNRELYVRAVLHKALVEVDEEGTVAAAATVVRMGIKSAAPQRPFVFHANRPFLFFIMDIRNNVILFMGVLRSPGAR